MNDELASMLPMIAAGYYVYFIVMAFFPGGDNLELMKPLYFLLLSHRTQFYFICPYC